MTTHNKNCTCGCKSEIPEGVSRKDFLKKLGAASIGLGIAPLSSFALTTEESKVKEILKSKTVKDGKAQHITLLHTTDIHGQINVHDEFFWEDNQVVFKKRGGFAHLKTMINEFRKQNTNTLLLDGGDCFQGSGLAYLSEGRSMIPLMNNLNYDLVLPGNWEVVHGKKILIKDLGGYNARKVCANMFNDDTLGEFLFPPYQVFYIGGIKIGFIGYNDPLTPIRQAPDYSKGIKFTEPEKNIAKYIRILREDENCKMVFVMSHMGLSQQINLASQSYCEGVDYILGADTHERVRTPLKGKYAKVTESGAFASFIGKLDIVIENGIIKEESYELIDVDPEKYAPDQEMLKLIEEVRAPYAKQLDKVVGKTKVPLMRYFVLETPMDNLIHDALMWKFSPDISISNGFRFCPPLVPAKDGTADITLDYLYSILPGEGEILIADVTGKQIWDWLEKELENVFAKDPTKRLGGWLVRFKGMEINFTVANNHGNRLNSVKIKGKPIDLNKTYKALSCEREGDPESLLCRIKDVKNNHKVGISINKVLQEYLGTHSPVSPKLTGYAKATDAAPTLLTQALPGIDYQFR